MRVFTGAEQLRAAAGRHLGVSSWMVIDQRRIDAFADATEDHQWIHVDPERAARGPFGATIAHGFLTLSLLPRLSAEVYRVEDVGWAVNYGINRLRFPAPVPVGSQVRADVELAEVADIPGGLQVVLRVTLQIKDATKPGCVAEWVIRYQF